MPLTKEGKRMARELGSRLPIKTPIQLFHSKIHRCKQTAESILGGLHDAGGTGHLMEPRDHLSCEYIEDDPRVFAKYEELGYKEFTNRWFKGELERDLVEPVEEAVKGILTGILEEAPLKHGLMIHVTHDWNLLLLVGLLIDLKDSDHRWPGFLSGVLLTEEDGVITIRHEDKIATFELDKIRY